MSTLLRWIDRKTYLMGLLFVFWAIFWGFNGLDKYFNGASTPGAAIAVLKDGAGAKAMTVHPIEPRGFFGVTRDQTFAAYFARLGLGRGVSLVVLHIIGVFEIVLGAMFLALLIWSVLPYRLRDRRSGPMGLFQDRTIHRLAFKGGIAVFTLFALGDILFGDRSELWEHGTYMVLCLITYDMWYRTDRFVANKERREAQRALHINRPITDELE